MISSSILTILICAKLTTSTFGFLTGNGIIIKNKKSFRSSFLLASFVLEETSDETLRDLATDALLPVIYNSWNEELSKRDGNNDHLYTESSTIDAERALKKCLRSYQKIIIEKDIGIEERQRSRKRLNDLVLGTSLMRIRYQFLCKNEFDNSQSKSEKRKVIRRMIDMHADFLDGNINEEMLKPIDAIESKIERISVKYSLPVFFVEMMVQQYGSNNAERFADTFSKPGPIYIRRNSIRCRSDQVLIQRLKDECFAKVLKTKLEKKNHPDGCLQLLPDENWNSSKISIWSMNAWKNGWFEVQDAGSQIIASALEAKHHETIVDYCCGNGGKTFAIASYMNSDAVERRCQPNGNIIAHDIVNDRMKQLKGSFTRTGCNSLQPDLVKTTLDDGVQFTGSIADAVLVDAPCSSTGVLRRRPSQRFKISQEEITKDFPRIQLKILKEASNLVKPGGRLVYATCSIFAHENQDVANAFENSIHFIDKWEPWPFQNHDNNEQSHYKSLLPNADNDGFFIARWKRKTQ
ncbi:hypothetical protein CTEN210_13921 [Chaetoceros tenuissimus]|uniref:SAM-dependent MTase RsmB/NOP-type domain-containing protein n=1 Tax=Chaetoceros tenuissimus TaxID=426638 RepID=A0AAD3D6J9_9STRA|nr:hypothetical protein CTEN210_13921 [Chaetoceros tenuissimus]